MLWWVGYLPGLGIGVIPFICFIAGAVMIVLLPFLPYLLMLPFSGNNIWTAWRSIESRYCRFDGALLSLEKAQRIGRRVEAIS